MKIDIKKQKSEGIATTIYFVKKENLTTGNMTVILDIGGGSTELVFVKDKNILFHDSVKFAGDNFILASKHFYNKIVGEDLSSNSEEVVTYIKRFNLKFSSGDYLLPGWNNKLDAFMEDKEFYNEIYFLNSIFYGSIMFYVGLHLANSEFNEQNLNVAFAGNGTRFLELITMGNKLDIEKLGESWMKFFKSMIEKGLNIDGSSKTLQNVEFRFSSNPKFEVVFGLLQSHLVTEYDEKERKLVKLQGLDIKLNNNKYPWNKWAYGIKANELISADFDLEKFDKFIASYWDIVSSELSLSKKKDVQKNKLLNRLKNSLEKRGSEELATPLFFECVNAYMQEYNKA